MSVGPIGEDRDLVIRFQTSLVTNGSWFSDGNGIFLIERIRNLTKLYPFASNVYPHGSRSCIRDINTTVQLTLVSGESFGCGSMIDGNLELFLHRRPMLGLEPNDTSVVSFIDLIFYQLLIEMKLLKTGSFTTQCSFRQTRNCRKLHTAISYSSQQSNCFFTNS